MSNNEQWRFRFNILGCLPDDDIETYATQEEAKRACIEKLKYAEDCADCEEIAEELCHLAEALNLESDKFAFHAPDGYFYCVERFNKY